MRIALILALAALPQTVRAEPIQITSGGLIWTGGGPTTITLSGQDFTFEGTGQSGIFLPWSTCNFSFDCTPGATVDLRALWNGNDLPGTATVDGLTFTEVGGLASDSSLSAEWTGSLTLPDGFTGGEVSAPFLFSGRFLFTVDPTQPFNQRVDLTGHGVATLTFVANQEQSGVFGVRAAEYTFASADPVPEPASMLLIGTGLAGLAALGRRRGGVPRDEP